MAFRAEDFVIAFREKPGIELIETLIKADLLEVGKHLKLSVKAGMKKAEIKKCVLQHYVQSGLLPESVMLEFEQKGSNEFEMKKLELEYQIKMKEIESRIRIKELELEEKKMHVNDRTETFDVGRHIKLVPKFHEKDVDKYFLHFEKVATTCKWPTEVWSMLLQSVLVGKAQEIYATLSVEQSSDYEIVKA